MLQEGKRSIVLLYPGFNNYPVGRICREDGNRKYAEIAVKLFLLYHTCTLSLSLSLAGCTPSIIYVYQTIIPVFMLVASILVNNRLYSKCVNFKIYY